MKEGDVINFYHGRDAFKKWWRRKRLNGDDFHVGLCFSTFCFESANIERKGIGERAIIRRVK